MAAPTPTAPTAIPQFTDVLQGLSFESESEILKKETGLKLAERLYNSQTAQSDNTNFFRARAAKWVYLETWALGKQSTKEFLDFMNVSDGNKSYVNIDMSPVMIGAQFNGTLVDSMSKNEEYPQVTAIDEGSAQEKERRKMEALYLMNSPEVAEMEDASGIKHEPVDAFVPENELAAEIHFQLDDRLPREIKMEQTLEKVLTHNRYQRILKRKQVFDLCVKNAAFTKIETDAYGRCNIRHCIPQNMLYNYFQGDSGEQELSFIGEIYSLKIKDLRSKYGISPANPKGMSEKDIYELARTSTQYNVGTTFNYPWLPEYDLYNYNRPWDDYSIPVFDFEINVSTADYSVGKVDRFGNENIAPKKSKPTPTAERSRVYKKDKCRWYRGVYAPFAKQMIYWGLPDIVLVPFLNVQKSLSSYSAVIPFNQGQYIPSLFERAMEPLKEYTITKLKRKQLIANLRPSGIRIDIESARNIDLGNGDSIAWEEVLRIYNQTGTEIWSSRGVDPGQRESPALSSTAQDDAVQKILQLTSVLQSCITEIRALLGVPMYRDGSDVGDRTAAKLAEQQNTSSYNVTDYIENAQQQLMEETLYKCLLYEWQKSIKNGEAEEDEINTTYQVDVRMRPTEYQKQLLAARIEKWSTTIDGNGNPLLSPKDCFYIENIKDFKLAQLYLSNLVETNRKRAMEQSAALQKQNSEVQSQAAQQAAENEAQLQQQKVQMDLAIKEAENTAKKQQILLDGFMQILKGGAGVPPQLVPLMNATFQNVAVPLVAQTEEAQKAIQEKMQAEAEQQAQQQQIMDISRETGMPPEQVMAEMQNQEQQPQQQMPAA